MMMCLKYESIKSLKMDPEKNTRKKHPKKTSEKHCIFICNSIMDHYDQFILQKHIIRSKVRVFFPNNSIAYKL